MGGALCRPNYLENGEKFYREIMDETDDYIDIKITDRRGESRYYKKSKSRKNSMINNKPLK